MVDHEGLASDAEGLFLAGVWEGGGGNYANATRSVYKMDGGKPGEVM